MIHANIDATCSNRPHHFVLTTLMLLVIVRCSTNFTPRYVSKVRVRAIKVREQRLIEHTPTPNHGEASRLPQSHRQIHLPHGDISVKNLELLGIPGAILSDLDGARLLTPQAHVIYLDGRMVGSLLVEDWVVTGRWRSHIAILDANGLGGPHDVMACQSASNRGPPFGGRLTKTPNVPLAQSRPCTLRLERIDGTAKPTSASSAT